MSGVMVGRMVGVLALASLAWMVAANGRRREAAESGDLRFGNTSFEDDRRLTVSEAHV
jgi:hypothetical protein